VLDDIKFVFAELTVFAEIDPKRAVAHHQVQRTKRQTKQTARELPAGGIYPPAGV
jgi:hypothetical protein